LIGCAVAAVAAILSAAAQELDDEGPANALITLPGQNDAQRDMAQAIDRACPTLATNRDELQGDQVDLADVCTAMVQTALDVPGSLGLSDEEMNAALQTVNGEELQNPQQQIVEIRDTLVASLQARIDAIRTGTVGPGLSLAGLGLSDGETLVAADDLETAEIIPAQWTEGAFLSRLGVFATGRVVLGDKDETSQSDGYDFETTGVTVGADYRLTDAFVFGGAFGYSYYDVDFDDTPRSPKGQDLDSDTYAFSLFGSYTFDVGFFTDAIATVGWADYDSKRKIFIANNNGPDISRTAEGSFDVFQYGLAARVGYDYTPEQVEGLTLTPIAGLEYLRAEIDGFTEHGAQGLDLQFDDFDAKSLTSNVGLETTYSISTGIGIITPGINGRWVHEFEDDDGPRVAYANDPTGLSGFRITSDDVTRNYGVVGANVAAQFAGGWAAFVDYATPVGLDDFTVHQINFGIRKEF
jgi:uncharacterized protein with beta-barrel porin domain